MFTARRKIQKEKGQEPDEFEESVAQVSHQLHILCFNCGKMVFWPYILMVLCSTKRSAVRYSQEHAPQLQFPSAIPSAICIQGFFKEYKKDGNSSTTVFFSPSRLRDY